MQENKLAIASGKSTVASRQGKLMVDSLKLGLAGLTFHKPCYLVSERKRMIFSHCSH